MLPIANGEGNGSRKTEQRAWIRTATSEEAYCRPIAVLRTNGVSTGGMGRLRDLSASGLALRLTRRFEPGTMLVIEWVDKPIGQPRCFPVQVVRATAESNGHWLIGCEFLRPLSEEELRGLLGDYRSPSPIGA